jgi:hypothetical protein
VQLFALLDINARKNADRHLAILQQPLYTYSRLQGKQTNSGGSGWSIEGSKKDDELFMAVKADTMQNAKQFNPQLLLFSSSTPLQTTSQTQRKGQCTPKGQSGISLHE